MRSAVWLIIALGLPLVAGASTNKWERRAADAPRGQAVKLYAQAIRDYGRARPPDVAGIARCLEGVPWGEADPREFKQLARQLTPLLEARHTKPEFEKWKRRIITKYRLLQEGDEPAVAAGQSGYDVPIVRVPAVTVAHAGVSIVEAQRTSIVDVDIPETTVGGVRVRKTTFDEIRVSDVPVELVDAPQTWIEVWEVPVLTPRGVKVALVDADAMHVNLAEIPEGTILLVRVDDSVSESIRGWTAVNELRFRVMGEHGMFTPHSYSTLGVQYDELRRRLENAGPSWRRDPSLLAEWEDYWRTVRTALDRRQRWHEGGQYGF